MLRKSQKPYRFQTEADWCEFVSMTERDDDLMPAGRRWVRRVERRIAESGYTIKNDPIGNIGRAFGLVLRDWHKRNRV